MLSLETSPFPSPIGSWSSAAMPPPRLTVSQWADRKRKLPKSSAMPGAQWRTDRVPYLRGPMDAVHEPGIEEIVLMKAAQLGGSEVLHNIIGYHMEHDPCPMLFVHPTEAVAEEWSKDRLDDMLVSSPELGASINQRKSNLLLKVYPNGPLAVGGANTPNTFARRSARISMGDDVDRFPPVIAEEGDPADLLKNRGTTFYNALAIFVSTPTLTHGRIDTLYRESDQRRYVMPCPVCARVDWITWNDPAHFRVAFDDRDPDTARLECATDEHGGCGSPLTESDRRAMVPRGWWKATKPFRGRAGFHIPAMISTLGAVTLTKLVDGWLAARRKGKESLRVFINTKMAEPFEDRGARIESNTLLARRESYERVHTDTGEVEAVEVPAGAVLLTAGVDVQIDRFEIQVQAWGLGDERWVVDWRRVPGDPKQPETQAALLEALSRKYTHASGFDLPIHATCLDTGYATEEMYDFVLAHQVRRIYATKGFAGRGGTPIVGKPAESKRGAKNKRPCALYPVNVDDAKADLFNSLTLLPGPGATHFPQLVDEDYFAQFCAEHKETRYNKSGVATHTVWVQDKERNEALDTAVLCLAAKRILNPNIRQMFQALEEQRQRVSAPTPTSPAPAVPTKPKPNERRVSHSRYLMS